jgi:hypothetical protein
MAGQPTAFSFTVDNFYISETRSRHEDTDFVSCTLQLQNVDGALEPSQTITKSVGNVNNGGHLVALTFPNVLVSPGQTVLWSYSIVNAGHAPLSTVQSGLENVGNQLLSALIKGLFAGGTTGAAAGAAAGAGTSLFSLGGTVVVAVVAIFAAGLEGLLTANCDGPVAAEAQKFTYDRLVAEPAQAGFFTQHPGENSPKGCGENSNYWVSWHIDKGPYKAWAGGSFAGGPNRGGPPLKLK